MGLLDDAIREHLELKRRRGADPAEVARAEQEALGPVRREPERAPVAEDYHDEAREPVAHDAPPLHEDAHADERHAAPAAPPEPGPHGLADEQTRVVAPGDRAAEREPAPQPASERAPADAPSPVPPPADAPARPADAPARSADAPAAADAPAQPPAEPPAPPPAEPPAPPVDPRRSDTVDEPTTEFRAEDSGDQDEPPRGAASESDEDVLEETPDFLQETPEHDRLWFEQRPPRDFDFDD